MAVWRNNRNPNSWNFGESLEFFEVAKLKEKYTKLGYTFDIDYRLRFGDYQRTLWDAHAFNPNTGDEIFFEVKSRETFASQTNSIIAERRRLLKRYRPSARFILVLAKETKPIPIDFPQLETLLFAFIAKEKLIEQQIKAQVYGFELNAVTDVEITRATIGFESNFSLNGFATLNFWFTVNDENIRGQVLHEGIPFEFSLAIKYENELPVITYGNINFDLSEL